MFALRGTSKRLLGIGYKIRVGYLVQVPDTTNQNYLQDDIILHYLRGTNVYKMSHVLCSPTFSSNINDRPMRCDKISSIQKKISINIV